MKPFLRTVAITLFLSMLVGCNTQSKGRITAKVQDKLAETETSSSVYDIHF